MDPPFPIFRQQQSARMGTIPTQSLSDLHTASSRSGHVFSPVTLLAGSGSSPWAQSGVRDWREGRGPAKVYVPQPHPPGMEAEVDFGQLASGLGSFGT